MRLLEDATETTRPASAKRRKDLAEMIRRWQRGFRPEGESIFPPHAPHPELLGDRAGRAVAGFAAFAPFALFVGLWSSLAWGLALGALALTFLAVFAVRMVAFHRALPTLVENPFGETA